MYHWVDFTASVLLVPVYRWPRRREFATDIYWNYGYQIWQI